MEAIINSEIFMANSGSYLVDCPPATAYDMVRAADEALEDFVTMRTVLGNLVYLRIDQISEITPDCDVTEGGRRVGHLQPVS